MDTIKKPAEATIGNVIEKICNGKLYTTEGAEKIGAHEVDLCNEGAKPFWLKKTLYRTPKGHYFLTVETGNPDERTRTDDTHLYDGGSEILPISRQGAFRWACDNCPDGVSRLEELGLPEVFRDLVLLADFRRGTYGETNYIHHVVYKLADGSGYVVATNEPEVSEYPESQTVVVSGVDGVEDFTEEMFLHDLTEAEVMDWAGTHLPVDMYVKMFGPVETA